MSETFTTKELKSTFGTSSAILESYVERPNIDDTFKQALEDREFIVVHGSSKQGKTSLWKQHLNDETTRDLNCANISNIAELHTQILKSVGYEIASYSTSTTVTPEISAGINLHFLEVKSQVQTSQTTHESQQRIELNPQDPNDILRALEEIHFSGNIIIEDFHYLDEPTQIAFTRTLKTFYDRQGRKFSFIIIGVWQEADKLGLLNGDLSGRLTTISADRWNSEELREVIERGENHLNITFDESLKQELIDHCGGAIYLLQNACLNACMNHLRDKTNTDTLICGSGEQLIENEIKKQRGRYEKFLRKYTQDARKSEYSIRKWITAIFVTYVRISRGTTSVSYPQLKDGLTRIHPRSNGDSGINSGNLTTALQNIAKKQQSLNINPPIFSYDSDQRLLYVVDRGFTIWLLHEDVEIIDEAIGIQSGEGGIEKFSELLR